MNALTFEDFDGFLLNAENDEAGQSIPEGSRLQRATSFLLKRATMFIMKPTVLQANLKELGLEEDKIGAFLKVWIRVMTPVLDNLESTTSTEVVELRNLDWRLDVELAASNNKVQRNKTPTGLISMQSNEWAETIGLTHGELLTLYEHLEEVIGDLDEMKN